MTNLDWQMALEILNLVFNNLKIFLYQPIERKQKILREIRTKSKLKPRGLKKKVSKCSF